MAEDELLSFVLGVVVLEILLGNDNNNDKERDDVGVGALLKNRCAYLISKSTKERTEHLANFSKMYRVRSHIVHRGKPRLNTDERALLSKLHFMCCRVIQEELKLTVPNDLWR